MKSLHVTQIIIEEYFFYLINLYKSKFVLCVFFFLTLEKFIVSMLQWTSDMLIVKQLHCHTVSMHCIKCVNKIIYVVKSIPFPEFNLRLLNNAHCMSKL